LFSKETILISEGIEGQRGGNKGDNKGSERIKEENRREGDGIRIRNVNKGIEDVRTWILF
jgi:hypothetical protein